MAGGERKNLSVARGKLSLALGFARFTGAAKAREGAEKERERGRGRRGRVPRVAARNRLLINIKERCQKISQYVIVEHVAAVVVAVDVAVVFCCP